MVIYENGDDGTVSAYVPDLPTIVVSGRDHNQARESVLKGIRLYLEELERVGEVIPAPSMYHEVLSV